MRLKKVNSKKIFSLFLSIIMVLGILSQSIMSVYAEQDIVQEISEMQETEKNTSDTPEEVQKSSQDTSEEPAAAPDNRTGEESEEPIEQNEISTYTVIYDPNGGTGSMASQITNTGTQTNIPSNSFIKDGYSVTGWNTSADGSGTGYSLNGSIPSQDKDASITLYAQWQESVVEVTIEGITNGYKTFQDGYNGALLAPVSTIKLLRDVNGDNHSIWPITFDQGKTITLDLNGHKIDRMQKTRVVNGGVISVTNKTILNIKNNNLNKKSIITGGLTTQKGGGIYADDSSLYISNVDITKNDANILIDYRYPGVGGGIYANASSLELLDVNIIDNIARNSGGIAIFDTHLIMTNGTISRNKAEYIAAGISIEDLNSITNHIISDVDITLNEGQFAAGGIDISGTKVTINRGSISKNKSKAGGGLTIHSSPTKTPNTHLIMNDISVTENISETTTGGVGISNATVEMIGGEIRGNIAGGSQNVVASGLGIGENVIFKISGPIKIIDNVKSKDGGNYNTNQSNLEFYDRSVKDKITITGSLEGAEIGVIIANNIYQGIFTNGFSNSGFADPSTIFKADHPEFEVQLSSSGEAELVKTNKYTLIYNGNFGTDTGTGTVASQKADRLTRITVSQNGFVRKGYTFTAWGYSPYPKDGTLQPGGTFPGAESGTVTTLYALWKKLDKNEEIKEDIKDKKDMKDVEDIKIKIDNEDTLTKEKKEELKEILVDDLCDYPGVRGTTYIPLRDEKDIILIGQLIKETGKTPGQKDETREELVQKVIRDIQDLKNKEKEIQEIQKVIDEIQDEDKKTKSQSDLNKIIGPVGPSITEDIKKDIKDKKDMKDVKDIKIKIDNEDSLTKEKKEELKEILVDDLCDYPGEPGTTYIPLRDEKDIILIGQLIKETGKKPGQKDETREELVQKVIRDIQDLKNKEKEKEEIQKVINEIEDVNRKNSAQVKLENIINKKHTTSPAEPYIVVTPNQYPQSEGYTVTLIPGKDDDSGVEKTVYRIKSGETYSQWITYTGSFTISKEATTVIEAKTVDKAGNESSVKKTTIVGKKGSFIITLNSNGGSPIPAISGVNGSALNLPVPTKEGFTFAGWYKDSSFSTSFTSETIIAENLTIYAKWEKTTFKVEGNVKDESDSIVESASVKIMAGSKTLTIVDTDLNGNFIITGVPSGLYNLVITKGTQTITILIKVINNTTVGTVTLPTGNKNSIVEVKQDTPDIIVNHLNKYFEGDKYTQQEKDVVESGGTVEIKLVVEKKNENGENVAANVNSIKAAAGNQKEIGILLELVLSKIVKSDLGTTIDSALINELNEVLILNIPLPQELQGKNNYVIYRYHESQVNTITTVSNPDGEFIELSDDGKSMDLHTKKFSTYAIAFDKVTPPINGGGNGNNDGNGNENNDGNGSGSGGGGNTSDDKKDKNNNASGSTSLQPNISNGNITGGKVEINTANNEVIITPDKGYVIAGIIVDGKSIGATEKYTLKNSADIDKVTAVFVKETELPYYIKDGRKIYIGFSANSNNVYKYIAPAGETVNFEENPKSFIDNNTKWSKPSIDFVTEREIFVGTKENTFGPNDAMTRGMFVTVIGKLYERSYEEISKTSSFSDVNKDSYYANYVGWAHENGIISGVGQNNFAPNDMVTREQMAVIIRNFAVFLNKAGVSEVELRYTDRPSISAWAIEGAKYCQETNIITGREGGRFVPKGNATRAEVSVVIEKFIKNIVK